MLYLCTLMILINHVTHNSENFREEKRYESTKFSPIYGLCHSNSNNCFFRNIDSRRTERNIDHVPCGEPIGALCSYGEGI